MTQPTPPTRAELDAARNRRLQDVLVPGLRVVLCGINPSLYSAAIGHHFGRPGNRFWPTLHRSGFTDRLLTPYEDGDLPQYGCGVTNIVARATARADELAPAEFVAGAKALKRKLRRFRPRCIAFLGITAYRLAFGQKDAVIGRQDERIAESAVWVLPNPSGLNAHYQLAHLAELFAEVRRAFF